MKNIFFLLFIALPIFNYAQSDELELYPVPKTSLNIKEIAKTFSNYDNYRLPQLDTGFVKVDSFEISTQVTLKLYKEYLADMKRDSSEAFYKKQFPDTTMSSKEVYQRYMNTLEFENYHVVGITWLSAVNFCKWLTLKDFPNDSTFRYRLPGTKEWIIGNYLYKSNNSSFNNLVSDWTYNAFDESVYNFAHNLSLDYVYFAKETDPSALKRKRIMGNSYLSNHANHYQYQSRGLKDLSFRIVKVKCNTKTEKEYIKGEKGMFTRKTK